MAQAYKAKWIISSKEVGQNVYENSALIVEDGKVVDIVSQDDIPDVETVEDFGNAVITSGFVNLGAKLQYNDVLNYKRRGLKWLLLSIKQFFCMIGVPIDTYSMRLSGAEKRFMCMTKNEKAQNIKNGLKKALTSGTTCLVQVSKNDSSFKKQFEFFIKLPIKTFLFLDLYSDSKKSSKKVFFKTRKIVTNLTKKCSDSTFLGLYAHSVWSVHKRLWKILGQYSKRNNLMLMTELLESLDEKEFVYTDFSYLNSVNSFLGQKKIDYPSGKNVIEYLEKLKVLNSNLIVQNGNYLESKELNYLAEKGVKFAYSPKTNEEVYKKTQKIDTLIRSFGDNLGFMTGFCPLIDNDFNILAEALAAKPDIPLEDLIKYLTIYPAKILGVDKIIGSLDFNKHADFNVFELGKKQKDYTDLRYNLTPKYVYIKGKKVVENGEIV